MMRLAEAAGVAAGPESRGGYRIYWTTFGPATVAMKRTENALVNEQPDIALKLAAHVPEGLLFEGQAKGQTGAHAANLPSRTREQSRRPINSDQSAIESR
jgi:hypothetical protein